MSGSKATLFATELSGAGGYDPGHILRRRVVNLSVEQFVQFEKSLNEHGFWELNEPAPDDVFVTDGAAWIIEGATEKYHVALNWSPDSEAVYEIGQRFLQLSGWSFNEDEIY